MLAEQYFRFIRFSINPKKNLSPTLKDYDWYSLYEFAKCQSILGIVFEGVKILGTKSNKPPLRLLLEWIASAEQIKGQNARLNKQCVVALEELCSAGYKCCLLKGQGNAMMYSNPFVRQSGDIDILIRKANREAIISWVKKNKIITGSHYQHIEYEERGVNFELHYMPMSCNNPLYHSRLQKWFAKQADKDNIWSNHMELPEGVGIITIPSIQYNVIYQLVHMMHHFFDEGIGLRQMMDYYYVLKSDGRCQMEDVSETLRYLGLWKFAGAVMYVMREVFALEEQCMIVPVDERRGKTLLNEILKGGNFGHYSGLDQKHAFKKYFQKTWRNIQLVKEYPAEALCEPFFRTWHYFWRLAH